MVLTANEQLVLAFLKLKQKENPGMEDIKISDDEIPPEIADCFEDCLKRLKQLRVLLDYVCLLGGDYFVTFR